MGVDPSEAYDGKVGETFVIQLKLINIRTAEVIRRVDRETGLRVTAQLDELTAEAAREEITAKLDADIPDRRAR